MKGNSSAGQEKARLNCYNKGITALPKEKGSGLRASQEQTVEREAERTAEKTDEQDARQSAENKIERKKSCGIYTFACSYRVQPAGRFL